MANEEAREAGMWVTEAEATSTLRAEFAAGVAEGRRQAREAAETVPVTQARNAALAAIDALGEDDRG